MTWLFQVLKSLRTMSTRYSNKISASEMKRLFGVKNKVSKNQTKLWQDLKDAPVASKAEEGRAKDVDVQKD